MGEPTYYIKLFIRELEEAELSKGSPLTLSERAKVISLQAHSAQTRFSDGQPYSVHTDYVADGPNFTEEERALGDLHDTIEKTGLTPEDLIFLGIPQDVVEDIVRLSVKDVDGQEIPYLDGIEGILSFERCRRIRKRDLEHNSSDWPAYQQQLSRRASQGYGGVEERFQKASLRHEVLYPLSLAFLCAAEANSAWRSKTVIDFMRSADCPEQFRERWDLLRGKNITSHPVPETSRLE